MKCFPHLITAATLLAGTSIYAMPAAAQSAPAGYSDYAGMQFAQRDNRRERRGPRMNSTRTSTEARVFTSRRYGGAQVNTRGQASASGDAWSVSEGDVYSRTDADGSEADAYGRSEAEALQRVRPPE